MSRARFVLLLVSGVLPDLWNSGRPDLEGLDSEDCKAVRRLLRRRRRDGRVVAVVGGEEAAGDEDNMEAPEECPATIYICVCVKWAYAFSLSMLVPIRCLLIAVAYQQGNKLVWDSYVCYQQRQAGQAQTIGRPAV